ncbi:unnamed protein product [Durusdinium trenchii]|uniref:General transcription factor IIH subunit 4 n=1 Tax=Durusdinium trenchii TaxID=1381693 RepID=A0ABP0R2Y2_9DINO
MADSSDVGRRISDFLIAVEAERGEILENLYADGASVRVIFREVLPPLEQQLVIRLSFGGKRPFQEAVLRKWCRTSPSLELLQRLRILRQVRTEKAQALMLHESFQKSLVKSLTERRPQQPNEENQQKIHEEPAALFHAKLMQHAVASWDSFLDKLTEDPQRHGNSGEVRAKAGNQFTGSSLMGLARSLGLCSAGKAAALTSTGFQFILSERQQQLWSLLFAFLKSKSTEKLLNALKIIFLIGELRLGQSLKTSEVETGQECNEDPLPRLTDVQETLVEMGILYWERGDPSQLFVTPAGLALYQKEISTTLSRITGSSEEGAFQGIIVESNFKVYCYTRCATSSSISLHVKLLTFFCEILSELPNFIVAQLTADSVLRALKRGIRVQHILRYLEAAAHPRSGGAVPSNVRGQLEVWESSRSRASANEAVLFEWQLGDPDDLFLEAEHLAREAGDLLWSRRRAFDLPPLLVVARRSRTIPQIRALCSSSASSSTVQSASGAPRKRACTEGARFGVLKPQGPQGHSTTSLE